MRVNTAAEQQSSGPGQRRQGGHKNESIALQAWVASGRGSKSKAKADRTLIVAELAPEQSKAPSRQKKAQQQAENDPGAALECTVSNLQPSTTYRVSLRLTPAARPRVEAQLHSAGEVRLLPDEKEGTDESRVVEFRTFADVPETPHQPIATAVFLRGESCLPRFSWPSVRDFLRWLFARCRRHSYSARQAERLRRRTMLKRWPGPRARLRAPPRCRRAASPSQ